MSTVNCPRCGASNGPLARYCITCGNPLAATATPKQPAPQPGYAYPIAQPYYPYQYPQSYWEVARSNKINNTLSGLLLLVIGVLIAWIPFAGFIGAIVGFIGGILILVGREPFGADHVRTTTLALIFFVVSIAVTVFGFFYAVIYGISNALQGGSPSSIISLVAVVFIIGGAIFGIAEVLLTYSLQKSPGHMLLWTAYGISVAIGIINALIINPYNSNGFFNIYSGTGPALFTAILGAIPAAIYGTAFYLARERIVRHEIPLPMSTEPGKTPW